MEDPKIIRLPPKDRFVGSCPTCGKKIWESYFVPINRTYKCIECKEEIPLDSIIPF